MSRPRYRWWGYAKNCIRDYPALCAAAEERGKAGRKRARREDERDRLAVKLAEEETLEKTDGEMRMEIIRMIYWRKSHNMQGAALRCHVSYSTARRWHGQFVRAVGRHLKLTK